jgi:hypothetical protein
MGSKIGSKWKKRNLGREFVDKAIKIHGNKYTYKEENYFNSKTKMKILCNKHNTIFMQIPAAHL